MPLNRPTEQEIRNFLAENAEPGQFMSSRTWSWFISGFEYGEENALAIAELCLITGQPMSAMVSSRMVLTLARSMADLEQRMNAIGQTEETRN